MSQIYQCQPHLHLFSIILPDGTPALGKTVTVSINTGGLWWAPSGGAIANQLGFGWYSVQLLPADTAQLGEIAYHHAVAGCTVVECYKDQVILPPPMLSISNELQQMITLLGKLVAGLCPTK